MEAYKVGVKPVEEFYGVMPKRGAAGGYFVTSGVFTEDARTFANGTNLELIDGRKLGIMIDVARTGYISTIPHDGIATEWLLYLTVPNVVLT